MSTLSGRSAADFNLSSSKKCQRSSSKESLQASLQAIKIGSQLSPEKSTFAAKANSFVKKVPAETEINKEVPNDACTGSSEQKEAPSLFTRMT